MLFSGAGLLGTVVSIDMLCAENKPEQRRETRKAFFNFILFKILNDNPKVSFNFTIMKLLLSTFREIT